MSDASAKDGGRPESGEEALPEFDEARLMKLFNTLLFETPSGQRFTQDSPILANVWLQYARAPTEPVDLILTVRRDSSTGKAAHELRKRIAKLRGRSVGRSREERKARAAPRFGKTAHSRKEPARMVYLPGQIAVRLYFDELMRVVLPATPWWGRTVKELERLGVRYDNGTRSVEKDADATAAQAHRPMPNWRHFPTDTDGAMHSWIVDALMLMRRGIGGSVDSQREASFVRELPVDFVWMVRIAGILARMAKPGTRRSTGEPGRAAGGVDELLRSIELDFEHRRFDDDQNTLDRRSPENEVQSHTTAREKRSEIVNALLDLYRNWKDEIDFQPSQYYVWRVTRNRTAQLAVNESTLTVKADAARRLFDISCRDITWAIVDSGIDRRHPAFRDVAAADAGERDATGNVPSRVDRTYDFTDLRDLLDPELSRAAGASTDGDGARAKEPSPYDTLVDSLVQRRLAPRTSEEAGSRGPEDAKRRRDSVVRELRALHRRIKEGNDIDWEMLEPLITDEAPSTPRIDHGTHVAGILGADWVDDDDAGSSELPPDKRPRIMQGTCPEIRLIDCRVFREEGDTDEFEILAAIQFLRWLNSRAGYTLVHGANLSLSLVHEVRRFACGQTPICVECNEAAALGVVIVAAAGNRGIETDDLELTGRSHNYRAISITDPGNADGVITVGATHRKRPHEYGVSYFSSRGPTGDGRRKPDLVAPGEKIRGPTPEGRSEYKDGTSMAAPHVSGAAAMLMSRHKELSGNPARVKEILCATATDLGREHYFQGHGLVDVLRALQSI